MSKKEFIENELCTLTVALDGIEYTGTAVWTYKDGLVADLSSYFDGNGVRINKLPDLIPAEVGRGKRVLLFKPTLTPNNINMSVGRPITDKIQLRTNAVIHDLPWEIPNELMLQAVGVQCEALRLWYGDETARIHSNHRTQKTKATFTTRKTKFNVSVGTLEINLGYKTPGWPYNGNYAFSTFVEAILRLSIPTPSSEFLNWAERIEGFFDILAAFPKPSNRVRVWFEGFEGSFPVNVRNTFLGGTSENNYNKVFISRSDKINLSRTFDEYIKKCDEIDTLRITTRYLSSDHLQFPEGFLSACNLIETLGRSQAKPRRDLNRAAGQLSKLVSHHYKYKGSWDIINSSILRSPSFKSCYEVVTQRAEKLGINVALKGSQVRDIRAAYRHDLRRLNHDDLVVMRVFVGFAWTMGLVEICAQLGISKAIITRAFTRVPFHMMRHTNMQFWSTRPEQPQVGSGG